MRVTRVAPFAILCFSLLFPIASGAQAPEAKPAASEPAASYEVKRGDTLFSIARRVRPEGVGLNKMVIALYRANPDAFVGGSINQLKVGAALSIPARDTVEAISSADAAQEVRTLTAAKPPAQPAAAAEPKPAPAVAAIVPKPAPRAAPGRADAEARYQAGVAFERAGNEVAAVQAYTEAGDAGHGRAQKRLGELYDRGSPAVPRDYQAAIRWYQKAREQGVAVPKTEVRGPAVSR